MDMRRAKGALWARGGILEQYAEHGERAPFHLLRLCLASESVGQVERGERNEVDAAFSRAAVERV